MENDLDPIEEEDVVEEPSGIMIVAHGSKVDQLRDAFDRTRATECFYDFFVRREQEVVAGVIFRPQGDVFAADGLYGDLLAEATATAMPYLFSYLYNVQKHAELTQHERYNAVITEFYDRFVVFKDVEQVAS